MFKSSSQFKTTEKSLSGNMYFMIIYSVDLWLFLWVSFDLFTKCSKLVIQISQISQNSFHFLIP